MSEIKSEFVSIEEIENKIYFVLATRSSTDKTWTTSSTLSWIMGYDGDVTKEIFAALESLIRKGLIEKRGPLGPVAYKLLTPHEIAEKKLAKGTKK